MEFESVDLADASSHTAPNHLPVASHALLLHAAVSRSLFLSLSLPLALPSFLLSFSGFRCAQVHIAGQIEIIHYLNSVATTVRDLLVDVAPDSPL